MTARANDFYERLTKSNRFKGHVYNTTTKVRIMQARFFLEHLTEGAELDAAKFLNEFEKRDMFLFGLVNSLRSSLDSFTHELALFYRGSGTRRDIHFTNLLNLSISLPPTLHNRIQEFQGSNTFEYLNKLRNAQQHRYYPLLQTRSVARMSLNIVGSDSEGSSADWRGDDNFTHEEGETMPTTTPSPSEPDLRLPDDPDVEPGDETYSLGRPLFGTMRHLYGETREFILSSYELAV